MKMRLLSFLIGFVWVAGTVEAQELITTAEAESGTLNGVYVQSSVSGYSGSGYVTGFDSDGDYVLVKPEVTSSGLYEITVRYRSYSGVKTQYFSVNGAGNSELIFPQTGAAEWVEISAGKYLLNAGKNEVKISSYWGYMDVDEFLVYTTERLEFDISNVPVDSAANSAAISLYNFLNVTFGQFVISGHTDDYYDEVFETTGYYPVLQGFDMQSFTQGYPYNWANGGFAFGAVDNGQVDRAIEWYHETGDIGVVSFQWHWCSPTGGEPGNNTFYTNLTDFDVRQAVISGTDENEDILEDIDAIAAQLKKLDDEGIPVFWRPLHEAGGAWFWWGAHGPEPCLALYDILYDRLQNYHGLHNLIWVWSSPEADWYPGNDKVDVIGYDSYPGAYNYTVQKTMFDQLHEVTEGKKMVLMTENGPLPDFEDAFPADAYWGLFMCWSNLMFEQNSTAHIQAVYDYYRVLVFDESYQLLQRDEDTVVVLSAPKEISRQLRLYPNPASEVLKISASPNVERLVIYDLQGRNWLDLRDPAEEVSVSEIPSGHYIAWVQQSGVLKPTKLIIKH